MVSKLGPRVMESPNIELSSSRLSVPCLASPSFLVSFPSLLLPTSSLLSTVLSSLLVSSLPLLRCTTPTTIKSPKTVANFSTRPIPLLFPGVFANVARALVALHRASPVSSSITFTRHSNTCGCLATMSRLSLGSLKYNIVVTARVRASSASESTASSQLALTNPSNNPLVRHSFGWFDSLEASIFRAPQALLLRTRLYSSPAASMRAVRS
mmetsp:Transcript_18549/g.40145  ORF Transcript_18549/g.40145 Transcript_18549/m.40145 type:complete len:211 (+) Transcript_18549:1120-1752(+)